MQQATAKKDKRRRKTDLLRLNGFPTGFNAVADTIDDTNLDMEAPSREYLVEHWPDSDDEEATESEGYNGEVWSVDDLTEAGEHPRCTSQKFCDLLDMLLTFHAYYKQPFFWKKKITRRRACGYAVP